MQKTRNFKRVGEEFRLFRYSRVEDLLHDEADFYCEPDEGIIEIVKGETVQEDVEIFDVRALMPGRIVCTNYRSRHPDHDDLTELFSKSVIEIKEIA